MAKPNIHIYIYIKDNVSGSSNSSQHHSGGQGNSKANSLNFHQIQIFSASPAKNRNEKESAKITNK